MSITFLSPFERDQALDCFKLSLSLFVMPHTTPTIRSHIQAHVASLATHTGPFDVEARVETDSDGTLRLTTTIKPVRGVAKQ